MNLRERWRAWSDIPLVRTCLLGLGVLLMLASPAVGILPGPGGVILFGAGLGLTLKYSDWAKRQYVRFKRKHPNKGRWADWGLRRRSALRREAKRKQEEAERTEASEAKGMDQALLPCRCCGVRTIVEYDSRQICTACGWEDDPVQAVDPAYRGGANELSLNQHRAQNCN